MTKLIHFFATIVKFNINSLILSNYILLESVGVVVANATLCRAIGVRE